MSPFDLAGPQFLLFYLALAAVTLAVLVLHRQGTEAGDGVLLSDPYEIAYLRGGWQEAIRLAIASLIERGLIRATTFTLAEGVTPEQVASPLERAVLTRCAEDTTPQRLIEDFSLQGVTDEIRASLARQGLLPDDAVEWQRSRRLTVALFVLVGTAAVKAGVALSHGRTNLLFLLMLTIVATIAAIRLSAPRRTSRGDATLHHLGELLAGRTAARRSLAANEATLTAAVFGLAAVPGEEWAQLARLHPRRAESSSGGSSSCGSAGCGSSSCGGGGGCGGCGGCGS